MKLYILCRIISYLPAAFASVKFHWLKDNHRFDCMVGITVEGEPVGTGTLISDELVVTSANPLEPYLKKSGSKDTEYSDPKNKIKLHMIYGKWDRSKVLSIGGFIANLSKRDTVWIKMGFNRTHSPIHDLIFITIKKDQVKKPPVSGRQAFFLNDQYTFYFTHGWTFAGFGYVDNEHVMNSTILESNVYEDSDEADCDEWIPRPWGRFVCLLNVNDVVGIQSGAPLFQNGLLRGVGSFALKKGKESILVFTDFSLYGGFIPDNKTSTTTQAPKEE